MQKCIYELLSHDFFYIKVLRSCNNDIKSYNEKYNISLWKSVKFSAEKSPITIFNILIFSRRLFETFCQSSKFHFSRSNQSTFCCSQIFPSFLEMFCYIIYDWTNLITWPTVQPIRSQFTCSIPHPLPGSVHLISLPAVVAHQSGLPTHSSATF